MKKSLIAMIAVAFCVSSAMAQVWVYDYAASFKRIDVTLKNTKRNGLNVRYDSPKVVSDKFTGYMVIDACDDCYGAMIDSDTANTAVVYVTRKGDKAKNVYRAVGTFKANMFGANASRITSGSPAYLAFGQRTKYTEASGSLLFPFDWLQRENAGFLGLAQQYANSTCINRGFGKVSSKTTAAGCSDSMCNVVKSLSGSMLSEVQYTPICGEFLFDICKSVPNSLNEPQFFVRNTAPVPGTFTLKLNTSSAFKDMTSFLAAENAIRKKNKWEATSFSFRVPEAEAAAGTAPLGLAKGKGWSEK